MYLTNLTYINIVHFLICLLISIQKTKKTIYFSIYFRALCFESLMNFLLSETSGIRYIKKYISEYTK